MSETPADSVATYLAKVRDRAEFGSMRHPITETVSRSLLAAVEAALSAVECTGEDVTDWQRGYRACSERAREAISRALLDEGK